MSDKVSTWTKLDKMETMLESCRHQFLFYAEQHRSKVAKWQEELDHCKIQMVRNELQAKIDDTTQKAETNDRFAAEIKEVLALEIGGVEDNYE